MPAATNRAAAAYSRSWFPNSTKFSPTRTPNRARYRSAAPTSMTPGKSLSMNAIGRSTAPMAATKALECIRYNLSRPGSPPGWQCAVTKPSEQLTTAVSVRIRAERTRNSFNTSATHFKPGRPSMVVVSKSSSPPQTESRSQTTTLAPQRAAASAAPRPAGPAPAMTTSHSRCSMSGDSRSLAPGDGPSPARRRIIPS